MKIEISEDTVKLINGYYEGMRLEKPNPIIIGEFVDYFIDKHLF